MNRPKLLLLLAASPLLALVHLVLLYALVTPACRGQNHGLLHGVEALTLLLFLALTGAAWAQWRKTGLRERLIAAIALALAALFTVMTLAQWFAVWMLDPCAL